MLKFPHMKAKVHPKYYDESKVTCVCGNSFIAGSTLPEIKVEICSACHPFFTGEMRYVDTQGRVEKFKKQVKTAKEKGYIKKKDRLINKEKAAKARPRTLREMLKKPKSKTS